MKTTAALISGAILFCWFIFCPVPGWTQAPEVPKASSSSQAVTEPAASTPAPSPPAKPGAPAQPAPASPGGAVQPAPGSPGGAAPSTQPPALEPKKPLNIGDLADGLDRKLGLVLLLTFVMGGLGGFVYELLILQGNIEWPHTPDPDEITDKLPYAIPKHLYDLGIFARVFIGGAAAWAALLVLSPSTTTTLLATSLVAGSAGTSVFRSIQDRLLAALAQKDAADKAVQINKMKDVNTQALAKLSNLKSAAAPSAPGAKGLTGVGIDDLDEIEKLLSEAKGLAG